MFKKPWFREILIGSVVWIIGSALWSFISNGLHIPGFTWSSLSIYVSIIFFLFISFVALPFVTHSLNLYFARKNLEFQREQLEYEERRAALQAAQKREPPVDTSVK
jgi:hypothetical protein